MGILYCGFGIVDLCDCPIPKHRQLHRSCCSGNFLSGNPVSFLLADFYHTFHTRHEKKGGTFLWCVPLLHMWMKTHEPQDGPFISKDLPWCHKFTSLSFGAIQWYKREWDTQDIILRCGGFPNVPMVGAHGCINYNHVLCMRQSRHAMNGPPRDEDLVPFVINSVDPFNPVVRKVRKAWTKIVRSGPEHGKKNVIAKELYMQGGKEEPRQSICRSTSNPHLSLKFPSPSQSYNKMLINSLVR